MAGVRVSSHAIDRWVERVDVGISRARAAQEAEAMVAAGRGSGKPPRWLRAAGTKAAPGALWVCWHERPTVALLVRDGTVLTVMTRESGEVHRTYRRSLRRDRPSRSASTRERRRSRSSGWEDEGGDD